jgi:hypothetical protein
MLLRAAAAFGAALASSRADAATESPAEGKLKVVYHLSDLEKVHFVLGTSRTIWTAPEAPTASPLRWSCMVRRYATSRPNKAIPK